LTSFTDEGNHVVWNVSTRGHRSQLLSSALIILQSHTEYFSLSAEFNFLTSSFLECHLPQIKISEDLREGTTNSAQGWGLRQGGPLGGSRVRIEFRG
jgi:hypothetical protein